MRKLLQIPARLDLSNLEHVIAVPSSRSGGDDVLIEGEWYEDDNEEQVDDRTDCAHSLWTRSLCISCGAQKNARARVRRIRTYISGLPFLLTSRPFKPAFMKASPSHRMRAYVRAKASPLNASDATRGAPSP